MPKRKTVLINVVLFAVYVISAKLSLRLAFVNASATAVWPPTGIAMAAFLIFGTRIWPAIFWGAFAANLTTAGTVITSLFIALGNTFEGALGGLLIKRYAGGVHAFERPERVFQTLLAAIIIPVVSATVGVTTLTAAGFSPVASYGAVWVTWWLGNVTGALVVLPAIVLWYTKPKIKENGKSLELALFFLGLLGISAIVFSGTLPYPYLIMAATLWVVFKFGPRETATAVLVVGGIGVWATIHGYGPFAAKDMNPNTSLIFLQMFLATLATTQLIVAALILERARGERRFRALIEKSYDAISLINTDATVLYASPSTMSVLGFTPEEFVGIPGLSLVHPDDVNRVMELLSDVAAEPNKSIRTELRIQKKNGEYIWVSTVTTNLLHDPAVRALVVNYRDISDRKKLELAKDEFMMISAHQLRAPLASMRWNIELLMERVDASMKKQFAVIYQQTIKLIDLVNELLDASRIIQGNVSGERKPTRIIPIIQKEIETNKPYAAKRHVPLAAQLPRTLPAILVDPTRFSWVVQNLLSNAIKYTPAGGTISLSVAKEKDRIRMSVADTGIGIPKAEQDDIFSKFFRASNARAVDPQGSGLGLFAVREYVKSWGGTISVESPNANAHGTTITIILPVYKGGEK